MNGKFVPGGSSSRKASKPSNPRIDGSWLRLSLTPSHPYVCPRCSKAFPTSQALGGHQNAHRKECRMVIEEYILARKRKERDNYQNKVEVSEDSVNNNHGGPVFSPNPLGVLPSAVSFSRFQVPNTLSPNNVNPNLLHEEYMAAYRSSMEFAQRRCEALRAGSLGGWPEDSSSATGSNPIGGWNPNGAKDGNEVTSEKEELDLTLRL